MTFSISAAESALVDACLNNERLAQKTLYDKYKDAMFTVAYRITNNFELAQDVLQDAFIQIFKSLKNFRKESTIGAWIKIIVCLLYTSPSPRDGLLSRMPSSA